jgi:hypothetical protein
VQQLNDLLPDPVQVGAQLDQYLRGDTVAFANKAKQDVLGSDVVMTELKRLAKRQLQHLFRSGRKGDVARWRLLALADDLLDLLPNRLQADAQRFQSLGRDAFTFVDEPQQDVLSPDVVVIEHPGFFLSQDNNPPRPVGKPLEHSLSSHSGD